MTMDLHVELQDIESEQHQDSSVHGSKTNSKQNNERGDEHKCSELKSERSNCIGEDLATRKLNVTSSVLDQIVCRRMQEKLSYSNAIETLPSQTISTVSAVDNNQPGHLVGRHKDQCSASSQNVPSRKSEKMNRRKRKRHRLGFNEHCGNKGKQIVPKSSDIDCSQRSDVIDLASHIKSSDTANDLTVSVTAWNQDIINCREGEKRILYQKEGTSRVPGMRFQALNAGSGIMKKGNSIFGMMSKFGDRKRFVCNDCGRSFNQIRVFNVHQQLHSVKRSSLPSIQSSENLNTRTTAMPISETAESKGIATTVISETSFATEEQTENHGAGEEVTMHSESTEENPTSSRSSLQDAPVKELSEDTNHLKSEKRKRNQRNQIKKENELESQSLLQVTKPDPKGYTCNTCQKLFTLPSFLRRHELVHTGEKSFACKFCGKCFGQKATKERHEATHGRDKPHLCQACGDGFSSSIKLEQHVKRKHTEEESKPKPKKHKSKHKPIKDVAAELKDAKGSSGIAGEDLNAMEESQSTEGLEADAEEVKVFKCPICDKTFNQRSHLSRHKLSHTGERPFTCKECGKGFSQKATCLRHERSHTGELPYICPECGNGFAQKSGLRIHRLIHAGERPHGCRFCDATFTQKVTRMRHERTHTGERPFVCQQCGKAFGQSVSLERHVKNLHVGKLINSAIESK